MIIPLIKPKFYSKNIKIRKVEKWKRTIKKRLISYILSELKMSETK